MHRKLTLCLLAVSFVVALTSLHGTVAQSALSISRITQPIDESRLAVLRGNTHPLVRSAYDRGPVADGLALDRMTLVLQRSPAQKAALDRLLAEQQDKNSTNYHHWLTADEFGQQFGASDQDLQKISAWLESHGFHVDEVSQGRSLITFSGNAAQVRSAFHTAIHQYNVLSADHIANSSDPEIPAALAPVVAGIRSLNDFFPQAAHSAVALADTNRAVAPNLTLSDANGNTLYGVGPNDLATIYGILPLWNASPPIDGTGVTIAVVSGSDINPTDVSQFRALFNLPTIKFNTIVPPGATDPGIQRNGSGDEDETEAIFDVEWSGAPAKNANIDLVASKDTATSAGIDISAQYIVDTMSPKPAVLSESYGACELLLGAAGNAFYNNLWSQAAAEGITVSVSSGDNGAAGCDAVKSGKAGAQPSLYGLNINGLGSTPYNIAVGGTDFDDHTANSPYWSSANGSGFLSAISYVPELTWNDSCTNSLIYQAFAQATAMAACNSTTVANDGNNANFNFVATVGSTGGPSTCTTPTNGASARSSCSGGYAKPSWQTGPGVPADGHRDVPDVSFFAEGAQDWYGLETALGAKVPGSFYFVCEMDAQGGGSQPTNCSTSGAFLLGGGTSISAQVFAGMVALVDQKTGSAQGNFNPSLYALAASQSGLNCNSSSGLPPSDCIFHDVTTGTISQPCTSPSANDGTSDCGTGGQAIGILVGYDAATGYDLATGLGSFNVANLANAMPYLSISASPSTVSVASPGQSGSTTLTFTANNGFTGTVNSLSCGGMPVGATCTFTQNGNTVSSLTFTSATTTQTVTLTVATTAAGGVPPARFTLPGFPSLVIRWRPTNLLVLTGLSILGFLLLGPGGRYRRLAFGAVFAGLLATAGCGTAASSNGGGGNGGTPTGTSTPTVTVTNTSSNAQISSSFTLTVQ